MIKNVTQEYAAKKAEAAQRTLNNYVGVTYPHYQGEIEELRNALLEKGCEVIERITPISKRMEYDVIFNEFYSGLICKDNDIWTLVVTNTELILV